MKWTEEYNRIFCEKVIDVYRIQQKNMKARAFIRDISGEFPFSETSLRRKLYNTKRLFEENHISNTLQISLSLKHYSKDHEKVFKEILNI